MGRGEGGGGDDDWLRVTREVRLAITELESLKKRILTLKNDITSEEERRRGGGGGKLNMDKLLPLLKELRDIEQLRKYLLWMNKTQQLR